MTDSNSSHSTSRDLGIGSSGAQDWKKILGDHAAVEEFRSLHWEGSFFDYLEIVKQNPAVARNAFQRMYDMITGWGTSSYVEYKKSIVRYKFFDDPIDLVEPLEPQIPRVHQAIGVQQRFELLGQFGSRGQ